jgi:predicted secreted hydrolase
MRAFERIWDRCRGACARLTTATIGQRLWRPLMFAAVWSLTTGAASPPPSDLDPIRSGTQGKGFALVTQPRTFEFPHDHGPHPEFRHEWWYVTGNLDSASGERFGFELTFFRIALAPLPGDGSTSATGQLVSGWRTRQVYAAHFAITDVARGQFHFAEKLSRDALRLAGAQAQPFRVWLDDWVLGRQPASADWMLHAQGQGYELTLEADPLPPTILNGDQGLSRKSSEVGAASYYYSIPRVAVHGKLARGGAVTDVTGLAWLDREWGSGSLGARQRGWDWFALQLQDGGALMFYSLRDRDGTRDSHSAGTWVDPSGRAQPLSTDQVDIEVQDHWNSPGGGRYPSQWRVRIPAVGLDVEARPVLADQELRTKPRYWEGAVDVQGTRQGHDISGRGYVELVGYGE